MFNQKNITITAEIDARKQKLESDDAWDKLSAASTLIITKGKKVLEISPTKSNKNEILTHALGRSGTLRAPTLKLSDKIIVGFQEDLYSKTFV